MKTYRVGFAKSTGRDPVYIEAEDLQVIDGGRKVYFRDSIRVPVAVYSEGAGIVPIEPVEDPKVLRGAATMISTRPHYHS